MPYQGGKVKRDKKRLADAIVRAQTTPLKYDTPLIDTQITSPFGPRIHPITKQRQDHTGVDLRSPVGDPVFATEDGFISQAQNKSSGSISGNNVRVKHADGRETRYAHLDRFAPAALKGGFVKKGELLGYSGTTGRSTGPHLHYGMYKGSRPIDPFG